MSMFSNLKNSLSTAAGKTAGTFSKMREGLSRAFGRDEDPVRTTEKLLQQAKQDLVQLTKETNDVIAHEHAAYQKLLDAGRRYTDYAKAAERAVRAGRDDDALRLLETKEKIAREVDDLREKYLAVQKDANELREVHKQLCEDVAELELRHETIEGKAAAAQARERMNRLSSDGAFDQAESQSGRAHGSGADTAHRSTQHSDSLDLRFGYFRDSAGR